MATSDWKYHHSADPMEPAQLTFGEPSSHDLLMHKGIIEGIRNENEYASLQFDWSSTPKHDVSYETNAASFPDQTQEGSLAEGSLYTSSLEAPLIPWGLNLTKPNQTVNSSFYEFLNAAEPDVYNGQSHSIPDCSTWHESVPHYWRTPHPLHTKAIYGEWDTGKRVLVEEEEMRLNLESDGSHPLLRNEIWLSSRDLKPRENKIPQTFLDEGPASTMFKITELEHGPQPSTQAESLENSKYIAANLTETTLQEQVLSPSPGGVGCLHREARNQFLVHSKLSGMSYKEIKEKGHFKEAESTLRGRFRTLTKHKDQRVRKPQWQEKDLQLLRQAVTEFTCVSTIDRVSTEMKNAATVIEACKIPWKKVSEFVATHGGYHFGNATCRRKWDEMKDATF